jgi:deazaflavin-dependent oxidoreductase (nitroreductase family)
MIVVPDQRTYQAPTGFEKAFNRLFGFLAGIGIAPSFIYLLKVRGRKSGKVYSTAVNLLQLNGKQYLVAPRGRTQWVKNAESVGEVTLTRLGTRTFGLRTLTDAEKPEVLRAYLTNYKSAVQKFFPIQPDAALEEFARIEAGYPAFELLPVQ